MLTPLVLISVLMLTACPPAADPAKPGDGVSSSAAPLEASAALERYADLVLAGYQASLEGVVALEGAVEALLKAPSDQTLAAAREAWLAAREPYGQTEVFRFYGGPIDHEEGPEGQINAWPLDEAYIDAIVADASQHPELTPATLAALNEKGGEKNIATGYHAIEYLLWGADTFADSAGQRPASDYGADEPLAARRAAYLRAVVSLLKADLAGLIEAWKPEGGAYRAAFLAADARESVGKMLTGMGSLSGAELAGERMTVAYDTREQEDEHSCFSDNTHRDIILNALGIQNVYLGRFGGVDGPGLDELLEAKDPALAAKLAEQLEASVKACQAIPAPFDTAINDDAGRAKIKAAITALRAQTETIAAAAAALDIKLAFE